MKKKIKIILGILVIYLLAIFIVLVLIQKHFFFHPWHDEEAYKILHTNNDFKEVYINNNGENLNGWIRYNVKEKNAPLVIFYGGNAENSSSTVLGFLNGGLYKYFENYNLLMVDYPEYGLSQGKITEESIFNAGLAIYDYAANLEDVNREKIVILGYSIGTGVATYVSSQRDVNGLILIAPYDKALSLYNNAINIFHGPLKIFTKYKLNSMEYAKKVNVAPLIYSSYQDEVVSYELAVNLEKNFKVKGKIELLENTKHNEYFSRQIVLDGIYNYLQERR